MTRSEIALLLGAVAARDQRTVGETDVLAWHEDLGDLDYAIAKAAAARHFRESIDRIMPAHIRRLARIIRDELRASTVVKALPPGRFEDDPERRERAATGAARVRELLAELAAKRSMPGPDQTTRPPTRSESIHDRALARARGDRRTTKEN